MAESLAEEAAAVSEATGASLAPYAALALVAFRGREAEAARADRGDREGGACAGARERGLTFIHWATAVLYNGLGRYEDALAAARQAAEDPHAARGLATGDWSS